MHNASFLRLVEERVAVGSIPISTVRRMGPSGTMKKVHVFLCMPETLSIFSGAATQESFYVILDEQTKKLQDSLGVDEAIKYEGPWGTARKCLNIFLYEAFLNRYLSEHYGLAKLEPWLEVPLDSRVVAGLANEDRLPDDPRIPVWDAVIRLQPIQNDMYQRFASIVANRRGICRVHLELYYYRPEKSLVNG